MSKVRSDYIYTESLWKSIQNDRKSFYISDKTKLFIQQLIKQIKQPRDMERDEQDIKLKLRSIMNKVTPQRKKEIIQIVMSELMHMNTDLQEEVFQLIFDICSKNRFYTDMYASIYIELMCTYKSLKDVLYRKTKEVIIETKALKMINPDSDYDEFCVQNKHKDEMKSIISFFISIMAQSSDKDIIHEIFYCMLDIIRDNKEQLESFVLGEFIEYIHIMIEQQSEYVMKMTDIKNALVEYIQLEEERKSLSMRYRFKLLDMKDKI